VHSGTKGVLPLVTLVIPTGFEPVTHRLEICCSIQLSYGTVQNKIVIKYMITILSGWQDSNLRPPAPKAGAIPGYATPRKFKPQTKLKTITLHLSIMRRVRDSNPRYPCEVRQFSKRLLSASQATLLNTFKVSLSIPILCLGCAKVR
jgi:hypothetical protein